MAVDYIMRGYKTSLPDGYVSWSSLNAPDYTGVNSPYNPAELENIVIDYTTPTRVNGTAGPIIGFADGDLAGTYPNPTVVALQTNPVSQQQPTDGQVLTWSQAQNAWVPMVVNVTGGSGPPIPANSIVITDINQKLAAGPTFSGIQEWIQPSSKI